MSENKADPLLPCPFCGKPGAICCLEDEPGDPIGFWVSCSCGIETNERRTEQEARALWNTRAARAAPQPAAPLGGRRHPIEILWREHDLPEWFLGNDGTNTKLYALYDAIRALGKETGR